MHTCCCLYYKHYNVPSLHCTEPTSIPRHAVPYQERRVHMVLRRVGSQHHTTPHHTTPHHTTPHHTTPCHTTPHHTTPHHTTPHHTTPHTYIHTYMPLFLEQVGGPNKHTYIHTYILHTYIHTYMNRDTRSRSPRRHVPSCPYIPTCSICTLCSRCR